MKKIFLFLLKYIPIIQLIGMILNNIIYCSVIYDSAYFIDFLIGNSCITTILLYVCSIVFKYCKWHRIIIITNFINILIANIDAIFHIPIEDMTLIVTYFIISSIGIIYAIIENNKNGCKKTKSSKVFTFRMYR